MKNSTNSTGRKVYYAEAYETTQKNAVGETENAIVSGRFNDDINEQPENEYPPEPHRHIGVALIKVSIIIIRDIVE